MKIDFDWVARQAERLGWRLRKGHAPPVIDSPWGRTTEKARLAAAFVLRDDPVKREQVEALLAVEFGSVDRGKAEARRRYPEAYESETK